MHHRHLRTWDQLRVFLEAEVDSSVDSLVALTESQDRKIQWHREMLAVEKAERRGIDEAVRYFVDQGTWPLMNGIQTGLAFLRIDSALSCLSILRDEESAIRDLVIPEIPTSVSSEQVLHFLLIEWWRDSGRLHWIGWLTEEPE